MRQELKEIYEKKQKKGSITLFQGDKKEVMQAINHATFYATETEQILYIDPANAFNPEHIAVDPEHWADAYGHMKIARPLSPMQFILLMENLENEIMKFQASMVVITGMNTAFSGLKKREIKQVFPQILEKIKNLKQEHGIRFVIGIINTENPLESTNEILMREIVRNHMRKVIFV